MPNEPFSVDTDRIQDYGPYMGASASRITGLHSELTSAMAALDKCWGNDAMGKAFEEQYYPSHKSILQAIEQAGNLIRSTMDGIFTMAKGFANTEDTNMDAAHRLMSGSGDTGSSHGKHG